MEVFRGKANNEEVKKKKLFLYGKALGWMVFKLFSTKANEMLWEIPFVVL